MMRELKFRAFDTAKKLMINDFEIKDCFQAVITEEDAYYFDYEVMQYTGLKDNWGAEIYIGDIILFKSGDYALIGCEDYLSMFAEWLGDPECEDLSECKHWGKALVVGNKYENPELLVQ